MQTCGRVRVPPPCWFGFTTGSSHLPRPLEALRRPILFVSTSIYRQFRARFLPALAIRRADQPRDRGAAREQTFRCRLARRPTFVRSVARRYSANIVSPQLEQGLAPEMSGGHLESAFGQPLYNFDHIRRV